MLNAIKFYGILGVVEHYFQRRKLWSLEKVNAPRGGDSSVSDSSGYLQIIASAAASEKSFARFRSNREYRQILEHVSKPQGYEYLKEINLCISELRVSISKVGFLNTCGAPLVYFYPRLGFCRQPLFVITRFLTSLNGCFPI